MFQSEQAAQVIEKTSSHTSAERAELFDADALINCVLRVVEDRDVSESVVQPLLRRLSTQSVTLSC